MSIQTDDGGGGIERWAGDGIEGVRRSSIWIEDVNATNVWY